MSAPGHNTTDPLSPRLVVRCVDEPRVVLESTLLVHGIPTDTTAEVADRLDHAVRSQGATPCIAGVLDGKAIVGLTRDELAELQRTNAEKLNLSNLPIALHRGTPGATTVSATLRLAGAAGIRVFATGAMGGVHRGYADHLDISTDLVALSREPVALVSSGVKSLLDVTATREAMETLGIPVLGYQTECFPAFYTPRSPAEVDHSCSSVSELASLVESCLKATGRGVFVANPVPEEHAIPEEEFEELRDACESDAREAGITGRAITPFILGRLHERSEGRTLLANIALAESNARLAAQLASLLPSGRG